MPPKHFLTSNFRVAFEEYFDSAQQRNAVDILQAHIAEVRDGSDAQRRELGILKPKDTTPAQAEDRLASVSSSGRARVLAAARDAERRARAIREALQQQAAFESADKWTRE